MGWDRETMGIEEFTVRGRLRSKEIKFEED
jgi:hypothetical protein